MARTIAIEALLDEQPVRRFHVALILSCAAAMFADGFDVQVMGYIAPALIRAWHLNRAALGPALGAGLLGLMIGALVWSPVADRIGRKPVMLIGLARFGLMSLASAFAPDLHSLIVLRALTGLGLGGVMPNAVALTSEYAPRRYKTSFVILMWFGFTFGSGFGGGIAAALVHAWGWQAAFVFGGILPLMLVPLLAWTLPESVRILAARRPTSDGHRRIGAVLRRLDPSVATDDRFVLVEGSVAGKTMFSGLAGLFEGGRAIITLLLWIMFFANLLELYFLGNWMPTLMHDAGLSQETAILATSMIHFGAIFGTLVIGAASDRLNMFRVMTVSYVAAGIFTALIGHAGSSVPLGIFLGFGAGFFITGGQVCANALAAQLYPTASRATGIGWALGVGRLGSVVGPVAGGMLLGAGWSIQTVFLAAGLPSLLAAASVLLLGRIATPQEAAPAVAAEAA
jgi:AAHS family 4-hydroxybenzoate transporter-like MFS transporter